MNGLDLLILGIAAFATVRGLRRGLGGEAIGLGATALLLFAALPLAGPLSRLMGEWWPAGRPYASLLGLLLLLLAVSLLTWLLIVLWRRVVSTLSLGWLDALGGALFGLAKAVAVSLVIVLFLSWLPVLAVQRALASSVTASALLQALPGVCRQVEKVMPPSWSIPRPRLPQQRERRPAEPYPGQWRRVEEGRQV